MMSESQVESDEYVVVEKERPVITMKNHLVLLKLSRNLFVTMSYKGIEKHFNIGEYLRDSKTGLLTPTRSRISLSAEDMSTLVENLNNLKLNLLFNMDESSSSDSSSSEEFSADEVEVVVDAGAEMEGVVVKTPKQKTPRLTGDDKIVSFVFEEVYANPEMQKKAINIIIAVFRENLENMPAFAGVELTEEEQDQDETTHEALLLAKQNKEKKAFLDTLEFALATPTMMNAMLYRSEGYLEECWKQIAAKRGIEQKTGQDIKKLTIEMDGTKVLKSIYKDVLAKNKEKLIPDTVQLDEYKPRDEIPQTEFINDHHARTWKVANTLGYLSGRKSLGIMEDKLSSTYESSITDRTEYLFMCGMMATPPTISFVNTLVSNDDVFTCLETYLSEWSEIGQVQKETFKRFASAVYDSSEIELALAFNAKRTRGAKINDNMHENLRALAIELRAVILLMGKASNNAIYDVSQVWCYEDKSFSDVMLLHAKDVTIYILDVENDFLLQFPVLPTLSEPDTNSSQQIEEEEVEFEY